VAFRTLFPGHSRGAGYSDPNNNSYYYYGGVVPGGDTESCGVEIHAAAQAIHMLKNNLKVPEMQQGDGIRSANGGIRGF
jgi:hypothetical protein